MSAAPRGTRPVGGSALRRRSISTSAVFGLLVVMVVFAPVLAALAAGADVLTRRRGWPHLRLLGFSVLALGTEALGTLALGACWVLFGGGRFTATAPSRRVHFALQRWWASTLYTAARATLGLRIVIDDLEPAAGGRAVVVGRHASFGDAAIPAVLLGDRLRLEPLHVFARGLQWSPCIDTIAGRVGHRFVDRATEHDRAALDALTTVAAGIDAHRVAVIFPEGTFASPERRARAIERLRQGSRPHLAEQAAALVHLLPPRPAGTLALLDAAPRADVVVLGHVGFEGCSTLAGIYRAVPFREPVEVWLRRVPRASIPAGADRVDWLFAEWHSLDRSITARLARRTS